MLELLLRLFGVKRRRRRVRAMGPVPPVTPVSNRGESARPAGPRPPTPVETLQRNAERQNAEQAELLHRRKGKSRDGLLVRLGLVEKKTRRRSTGEEVSKGDSARSPVPPPSSRSERRPRKTWRAVMREVGQEVAQSWSGPFGSTARTVLRVLVVFVLPAAVVGVPAYYVIEEMRAIGVEVEPFSVPADVAKTGRTPEVLAQLLIDQVDVVRRNVLLDHTDRWPQDISGRQPPFALATEADTLHEVAIFLRGLTLSPTRIVSGSVTEQSDGKLSLRLYMTGMNRGAPVASLDGFNPEELNRVVAGAAPLMLRAVSPRLYAWVVGNAEQRPEVLQTTLNALVDDPASGQVEEATRNTVDFLMARNLTRSGRADEAMEIADGLIKRAPAYPPAYYARALAELVLSDGDAAMAAAQQARQLDGGNPWSYKVVARVEMALGHFADALSDIRVARRLDPGDGAAIVQEAEILLSMRRVDEAAAAVRQGMERAPGQPGVMETAAMVMLARGRADVAVGMINNELRLRPDRVTALIVKARLLSALGRGSDALLAADAALRLQPTNGTAQTARGYALISTGRPTEALALFEKLKEVAPRNATVLQGRALALSAIGRKDEAIAEFEQTLEIAPDFNAARRELMRLQGKTPPPLHGDAAGAAAAQKPQSDNFTAAPVDVGPAPAPAVPSAPTSQQPVAPGTFLNERGKAPTEFHRPDSAPP